MIVAAFAVTMLGNALVDPYDTLPAPRLAGWNDPKSEAVHHSRLAKAYASRRAGAEAVILGASTALIGLDPSHPGWKSPPAFNLALPGATLYELRRYLQHAIAVGPVKQAVLLVDLLQFNVHYEADVDFDESRLCARPDGEPQGCLPAELFPLLLSIDTLRSSWLTVYRNSVSDPGIVAYADGLMDWRDAPRWVDGFGGYPKVFSFFTKSFLWSLWFPRPERRFELVDPETGSSRFDELRRILEVARERGVELHVVIAASHAYLTEACRAVGLWPQFEEWKRGMLRTLGQEASHAGADPFPLWDFSGFGPLTDEDLPSDTDPDPRMRWYNDPVHFTTSLGDLVLDRVLGVEVPGRVVPEGFGARLTPANVEEHLASIRAARERYRLRHAEEVAEIDDWGRRARAAREAVPKSDAPARPESHAESGRLPTGP